MTVRVLLVRHLSPDGYPTARAEYCALGCGQAVVSEATRLCRYPLFSSALTGVSLYRHADGSTEHHQWVDRRAVVCCGAACVHRTARTA